MTGSGGNGNQTVCVGPMGFTGLAGATGMDGESAYQIAVENGFVGTKQEWLGTLIGKQGPAGIVKSMVAFFTNSFEGKSTFQNGEYHHEVTNLGYGSQCSVVEPAASGEPTLLINDQNYTPAIFSYSSAYDFTITSLAFAVQGVSTDIPIDACVKVAIFIAEEKGNIFFLSPSSLLTLSPIIQTTSREGINLDTKKELSIFVKAGQKVAIGIYTMPVSTANPQNISLHCFASGSEGIEF